MRSGHRYRVRLVINTLNPPQPSSSSNWRYCSVTVSNEPDDGNTCVMSPQLLFNLKNHTEEMENKVVKPSLEVDLTSRIPPEAETVFASCVSIGLVTSPSYPGHWDYSQLLSRYFSRIRRIYHNDVISISTSLCPELENQMDDLLMSVTLPAAIHFKIIQMKCNTDSGGSPESGLLIQKGKTKLIQLPAANSLVPSIRPVHLFDERILNRLLYLIAPYYNKKMRGCSRIILSGNPGSGKELAIASLSSHTGLQMYDVDVNNILLETPAATEKRLSDALLKAQIYSPCIIHLMNLDLLVNENKGNEERYAQVMRQGLAATDHRTVFIATIDTDAGREDNLIRLLSSDSFALMFPHHVRIGDPDERTREKILKHCTSKQKLSPGIKLKEIAQKTSGFTLSDLKTLVMRSIESRTSDILQETDILTCLKEMRHRTKKRVIGAPEIPEVKWSDVGGMENVKKEITDTIMIPLKYPHLFTSTCRRVGLLLHGPPGTGKTLIAKAIATECNISFLSVKGPELISMYVGQSESNVRQVFARARQSLPCVIFFDELDSLAPNRGKAGDSAGVMDRIVSQILAEMDNIPTGMFVIGATNRPDLIDPSLLRPGRFDKMIHVDVPADHESRVKILKALTRKFDMDSDVDFDSIEKSVPSRLSGADFYSLVTSAMNCSIARAVQMIEDNKVKEEDAVIRLTRADFDQAIVLFAAGGG